MVNLLINGGFEGGYRPLWDESTQTKPHHTAYVCEVDRTGGPITKRYTVERGEIHNPVGWWAWYAHQRNDETPVPWDPANRIGWSEPEIRLTETVHQRHRSGATAAYTFTWRRIHEGGLLQQVAVTPGVRLRFSAYTHAWIGDDDHPPTWSLPGYGALAWPASTPGLNDDQRSVTQSIGIDPTGGTDPYAPTVLWSPGWHIFNAYRAEPLEIEAVAAADTVTVFLRSSTLWPVVHNDVAWDDCELVELEPGVEPPSSGRGAPREQYARTYLLMHRDETLAMRHAAIDAMEALGVWWTLGQSADDAGIGDLDVREVIAVNPAMWDDDLQAFFEAHYPGVAYRPVYAATPADLLPVLRGLIYGPVPTSLRAFSQRNPRWATELMLPSARTIGGSGCAMVSTCSIATQVDCTLTPLELNRRLSANGGYTAGGLLYWRKVEEAVPGLRFVAYHTWRTTPKPDADMTLIRAALERGPCVIQIDHIPGGDLDTHFVVGLRMLDDDVEIIDPWYGDTTTLKTRYWRGSLSQSIFALAEYAIEDAPPIVVPPPSHTGAQLLSLHCQSFGNAEREFFRQAQPAVAKVFDLGAAAQIREVCPALIVYRHHIEDHMIDAVVDNPVWGVDWFIDQFPPELPGMVRAGVVNFVEVPTNEANQRRTTAQWTAAELRFIERLKARVPGARPLTMTISVGNPVEIDYPALIPLARATAAASGAGGYHGYKPVQHGQRFDDHAKWHECRHEEMNKVFRAAGIQLDWILTEVGACGGVMQGEPGNQHFAYDSLAGWRGPACFNGDWPAYLEMLRWYEQRLRTGSAQVLGATLFTTCTWQWQDFHLDENQLRDLVW